MRSAIEDGRLIPPRSLEAAQARRQQLEHEVGKIDRQIEDSARVTKYATLAEYARWLTRAKAQRSYFKREITLLDAWIEGQGREETAMEAAYEAFWGDDAA